MFSLKSENIKLKYRQMMHIISIRNTAHRANYYI